MVYKFYLQKSLAQLHIAFPWGSHREKYAGGMFLGGIANGSEHYHRKTTSFYI